MPKVEGKHLIFKASRIGMKTRLPVDNGNKIKLINKSFMCINKLSTFKLEKCINLIFKNGKIVQKLTKKALINVIIGDYSK